MIVDIIISATLVIAGIFGIVGSFGLIKLPDTMTRLHAPTKATTLGVGGVLIASMLYFLFDDVEGFSFHELMITIFLFLTAPIVANFIAKAHVHRSEKPEDLPETGTEAGWSTFEQQADPTREIVD